MTSASQSKFFYLTVTTLEDLHIGTGTGQGDIDARIMRDRNGCPVIRTSHFEGLLRQAGEELIALKALDDLTKLNALLGAVGNQKSQLKMTSLRTKNARTLVWGSTSRVPGKRQPQEDTLRLIEYVAAGAVFEATLRLPGGVAPDLLDRLLNRIDRIGGGRNRGAGLVHLNWHPLNEDTATPGLPSQPAQPVKNVTRIRLLLRNLEPLCLPQTGHPGNLIRTQSFIRGQVLRGAFLSWLLARNASQSGDERYYGLSQVAFGDALPLPESSTEFVHSDMPIPLSIMTPKPKGSRTQLPWWADSQPKDEAFDDLCKEHDHANNSNEPAEKTKRPGTHEYLCRKDQNTAWLRYAPVITVALRNQSADDPQKETELFSLEEIAEDTHFQAELRFQDHDARKAFCNQFDELLNGKDWLTIGRGGQPVIIEGITFDSETPTNTGTKASTDNQRNGFCLTLTSDAIVRGPYLGFLRDLTIEDLCNLADNIPCKNGWAIKKQVVETETIHGFNAVSGLQRSAALAIRRGSCWWIVGENCRELADALQKISAFGERTKEGLGRFAIDVQPIDSKLLARPSSDAETTLPENIQENRLKTAKKLADILLKEAKKPSASQLQWLRNRALACEKNEQLNTLLNEIREAPEKRPKSGEVWKPFKSEKALGEQFNQVFEENKNLEDKRLLISLFVQYALQKETSYSSTLLNKRINDHE